MVSGQDSQGAFLETDFQRAYQRPAMASPATSRHPDLEAGLTFFGWYFAKDGTKHLGGPVAPRTEEGMCAEPCVPHLSCRLLVV